MRERERERERERTCFFDLFPCKSICEDKWAAKGVENFDELGQLLYMYK